MGNNRANPSIALFWKEPYQTQCTAQCFPCPICGNKVSPTVPVCLRDHSSLTYLDFRTAGVIE